MKACVCVCGRGVNMSVLVSQWGGCGRDEVCLGRVKVCVCVCVCVCGG